MSVLERRTYMKADERRAQILGCAREVFAKRGYHVATVSDICQAAKIGRGTLYQYFGNKHEVFAAVLEEIAERVREVIAGRQRVAELAGVAEASADQVVSYCEQRLRTILEAVFVDEDAIRLLFREARGVDGAIDELIASVDAIVLEAMAADLEAGRAAGIVECEDPALTALFALGGVEKLVISALASDQPLDIDRICRITTHLQFVGMLAPATRRREENP
jgi:AcrR family transcriptional regulator